VFNLTELTEKLELHRKYLTGEEGGKRLEVHGDLRCANLRGADLRWAILRGANLERAYLRGANLSGVDLTGAELQGVDLRWANLQWVNLQGVNLRNARFYGVNLTGAILPEGHQICPPVGTEFPGWKKRGDDAIVKLLIPSTAERCNGIGSRKCRASEAVVVGVTGGDGSRLSGTHNKGIEYLEGMTVTPDKYDGDIRVSCTNGIHFFLTEREAQEFR